MEQTQTKTDWTGMVEARLDQIDTEIEELEGEREQHLSTAKGLTMKVNALRREREQVAAFPQVGKRKQAGTGTDSAASLPLGADGETNVSGDAKK